MSSNLQANELPTEPADDEGVDVVGYLRLLWSYKWAILLVTVVVTAGVTVWTLRQPKVYVASATIEYDPNTSGPLGDEIEDVANPIGSYFAGREFFATQNRVIASRAVAERVVTELALHQDPSFFNVPEDARSQWRPVSVETAARSLQARLSVQPVEDTRLVAIQISDQDPARAADLANAVAQAYIDKTLEDRMGSTVSALEWLGTQHDTLRHDLEASELALHHFKESHNVLSVSMEDRQNLVASDIQHFNNSLTKARTRRIELQARARRVRTAAEVGSPEEAAAAFQEHETIASLREQLREKISEQEGLGTRYGANHQRMQQLQAEIDGLRTQLSLEIQGVVRAADNDVREVQQIESGLRSALEASHDDGLELNLREIEYQRLNRARANNSKLYDLVLQRQTETNLTQMIQSTHVRMLDRALDPRAPISPNVATNVAGGLGAGLALGLGLAFLLSQLDRRLRSVAEVEGAGLQLLGILPRIEEGDPAQPDKKDRAKKRRRRSPPTGIVRDVFVHTHPMSAAAECCRTIRTNLTFMSADDPIRSLVITSASPREGKTTVTTNLAISLAQSGKRVLVIDTDLRRPRIHRAFGVSSSRGVSSVIVGDEPLMRVVAETNIPNLFVLPSGPIPPNPSELLHSQRFADLIEEALENFDRVICDSPPLGAVTDAAVLAPQLDATLLVVKALSTTRDALRSALRQLRDVGGNVVGGVLNDIDPRRQGYGAGDYYYYYRREGYYAADDDHDEHDEHGGPGAHASAPN